MRRVAVVIGTRPEAIKLAPVVRALRAEPGLAVRVVATAQHRDMLDRAMAEMGLAADRDLDLMEPAQTLSAFAGRCLAALGETFATEAPDYVVAQGDTTTVFCAALAAYHARIAFGHVEAGLRSGDEAHPFPEEMNRILVARMARHHFAPTPFARGNLLREGIPSGAIHVTGNTVIDALLATAATLAAEPPAPGRALLVTVHRRENVAAIAGIARALLALLDRDPPLRLLWPVHPNPAVAGAIRAALPAHPRIALTPPLDYRDFVRAMRDAWAILTDSGGVQEEAPALDTPVLVLRKATERPEAVMAGAARLIGTDPDAIVAAVAALAADPAAYAAMRAAPSPHGDGHAAPRIARLIAAHLHG